MDSDFQIGLVRKLGALTFQDGGPKEKRNIGKSHETVCGNLREDFLIMSTTCAVRVSHRGSCPFGTRLHLTTFYYDDRKMVLMASTFATIAWAMASFARQPV